MVISNIFVLSYALTYKYELTLMVGASLRLASRQESFQDSRVGGLTSKGQVGVLLWEHRGWMLHMALSYKAKNIGYNSMLSSVPTYSILLSTIFDGPPLSPERETCCMLSICGAFEFLPLYKRTFRFVPAILEDCTVPRIRSGFLPTYEPWLIPTCESYDSHRQQT